MKRGRRSGRALQLSTAAAAGLCLAACGESDSSGSPGSGGASVGGGAGTGANAGSGGNAGSSGSSSGGSSGASTGGSAGTGGGGGAPKLEGYGTQSPFGSGAGSESCVVKNTNDSGPDSLRECITDRNGPVANPTPRIITFSVSGTITLLSDLRIRQPYLTVDGLSAPAPGITIEKQGDGTDGETGVTTWKGNNTCGHDVLVQGLRFKGTWPRNTETHNQNAGNMSIDGEDLPGCLKNVVLWRNTYVSAQDSSGDMWGSMQDVTFAYNLVIYSLHPQSISHFPGDTAGQEGQRISVHHNVYAHVHERIPNVRGNIWDANIEQNIFHRWAAFGFGGGYATKFRCRGSGCPMRINLLENHYTSTGTALDHALDFQDGADPAQVFSSGNRFPKEETEDGSAAKAFPRTDSVTLLPDNAVAAQMLPHVGQPTRTAEESAVLKEIETAVSTEVGN